MSGPIMLILLKTNVPGLYDFLSVLWQRGARVGLQIITDFMRRTTWQHVSLVYSV